MTSIATLTNFYCTHVYVCFLCFTTKFLPISTHAYLFLSISTCFYKSLSIRTHSYLFLNILIYSTNFYLLLCFFYVCPHDSTYHYACLIISNNVFHWRQNTHANIPYSVKKLPPRVFGYDSLPQHRRGTRIGGNTFYKPPGPFYPFQDPREKPKANVLEPETSHRNSRTTSCFPYVSLFWALLWGNLLHHLP